jgi:hypothetical protein
LQNNLSSPMPYQYHSLSLSFVYSLYFNHPSATQEAACLSPGATLFYNQVLLLMCQGHTFT